MIFSHQFGLLNYKLRRDFLGIRWIAILCEQPSHRSAHVSSHSISLRPIELGFPLYAFGEFPRNSTENIILHEFTCRFIVRKRLVKRHFLLAQSRFASLFNRTRYRLGKPDKLFDNFVPW
jgi:hypothetical protein